MYKTKFIVLFIVLNLALYSLKIPEALASGVAEYEIDTEMAIERGEAMACLGTIMQVIAASLAMIATGTAGIGSVGAAKGAAIAGVGGAAVSGIGDAISIPAACGP
jgi:hypothetical protein